jgi:hypothetical protein
MQLQKEATVISGHMASKIIWKEMEKKKTQISRKILS